MARNRVRRQAAAGGYSSAGASKFNIRETVFVRLVLETGKYLLMKDVPFGEDPSPQIKVQRGIVRGMALAMTKMYGNGYEPYWSKEVKRAEKAASQLAREWINDGQPEDDGWWTEHRGQFWVSRYDQGGARV